MLNFNQLTTLSIQLRDAGLDIDLATHILQAAQRDLVMDKALRIVDKATHFVYDGRPTSSKHHVKKAV